MTHFEAEPCASGCEASITADLLTVIFSRERVSCRDPVLAQCWSGDGGVPQRQPLKRV